MASVLPERVEAIMRVQADLRWQKLRDLIEEYGRACYERGAEKLMERLAEEAAKEYMQHDRADVALVDFAREAVAESKAGPCLCVDCAPVSQADGAEACS